MGKRKYIFIRELIQLISIVTNQLRWCCIQARPPPLQKLASQSLNMQTAQSFINKEFVPVASLSSRSTKLICLASPPSWFMKLVHLAGHHTWFFILVCHSALLPGNTWTFSAKCTLSTKCAISAKQTCNAKCSFNAKCTFCIKCTHFKGKVHFYCTFIVKCTNEDKRKNKDYHKRSRKRKNV